MGEIGNFQKNLGGGEAEVGRFKGFLVALGVVGTKESVPAVRSCLGDEEVVVRVEAAHALGLIARTVRAAGGATDGATVLATDGEAGVDGCEDLVHIAAHAKSDDELRAALWALAQLDTRDAWSALRAVVADDKRTDLARRTAAEYLARPRVSLVLE